MPSFTIADCPASLAAIPTGKQSAEGKLSLTVRNSSDRLQTARITVASEDADPSWFSIEGAPPTRPNFLECDFAPNATQTITVAVKAPLAAEAKTYTFRVDATAEERPDDDHTEGPVVSLSVPAAEREVVPPPCKWCKPAIAAAVVLVVGIGAWFVLFRGAPELPSDLEGMERQAAIALLMEAGFDEADIFVEENGPPMGEEPGTVGSVSTSGGGRRVTLVIDPGVQVNAPQGSPIEETVVNLMGAGLVPEVARIGAADVSFFRVETVSPEHGQFVAKNSPVRITTYVPQNRPTPPNLCERIRCDEIIFDLERLPMEFERPALLPGNQIRQGVQGIERINPELRFNESVLNPGGQD